MSLDRPQIRRELRLRLIQVRREQRALEHEEGELCRPTSRALCARVGW